MSTYISKDLRRLVETRSGKCCEYCKSSFDPQTREFSFLYHPRRQIWSDHFHIIEWKILGLTAEGRTTVELLQFNRPDRIAERQRYLVI